MTDDQTAPEVTHRPLTDEAFDLDQLAPAEREKAEAVMAQIDADLQALITEHEAMAKLPLIEQAQLMVGSWNKDPERLRELAEAMTGNPVASCVMVLDGVQDNNLLISFQTEFARKGTDAYLRWATSREPVFADARAAARKVIEEEMPDDSFERGELTTEQVGAGIASLIQGVFDGSIPPGEAKQLIETVDGVVEVTTISPEPDPED